MSKENWKKTGKELGGAFEGLAKNLIRSAVTGVEKAEEWAMKDEEKAKQPEQGRESNVFNDGSWRETGKDIGHAMKDLGKTIVNSGSEAVEKADDWAEKDKK